MYRSLLANVVAIAITVASLCCGTRDARANGGGEPGLSVAVAPSLGVIKTGADTDFTGVGLLALDVSWRTANAPLWVRGEAAIGLIGGPDSSGEGRAYELRAGIEHRRIACGRACFYYGVDVALARDDWHDASTDWQLTSVLAIPRGGIDVGSDHVRFRLGIELPLGVGREHEHDTQPPLDSTRTPPAYGLALTTALAIDLD